MGTLNSLRPVVKYKGPSGGIRRTQLTTKSRSSDAIQSAVRAIGRPMRGLVDSETAKLEKIAVRAFKAAAEAQMQYLANVLEILGLPRPKQEKGFTYAPAHLHLPGCSCGSDHRQEKAFTPHEVTQINRLFENLFGKKLALQLDNETEKLLKKLISSPAVNTEKGKDIFKWMLYHTTIASGDGAIKDAKDAWKKLSDAEREGRKFDPPNEFIFIKDKSFVKEMFMNGYTGVSSKLTLDFLPAIQQIMNNALLKENAEGRGMDKDQVARLLMKRAGEGALWHWQRLVRTEMSSAIDKIHYEMQKEMGIEFVKYQAASDACDICRTFADFNSGYYPIEEAPNIPENSHPNCRCNKSTIFNLPKGVSGDVKFTDVPKVG